MNQRKTGTLYEEEALNYLRTQGFLLKEKNYRCRFGEIDLIGFHHGYLVFVEVKYRKSEGSGYGEEAVTKQKQQRICKSAQYYMLTKKYQTETPVRYDVISFLGSKSELTWYQDAFPHCF